MKYITFNTTKGTKLTPSNLDKWARVLLMMPKGETVAQFLNCLATLECIIWRFQNEPTGMGSIVYYY